MAWALTDLSTAVDISASIEVPSLLLTQRAYAETSRLSFKVRDELAAITIATDHEFVLMDAAVKIFAGYARQVLKQDTGVSGQRIYSVECQDYTTALADDVVDTSGIRANGESDAARIAWLFSTWGTRGIVVGAAVQTVKAVMPDQDFSNLNLHQSLTLIASVTGASFFVDYDKGLHYFTSEVNSAPFNLSDTPNFSTTWPYEQFSEATDSVDFVNAVWVVGDGVSGWRPSAGAVAALRAAGTLRATVLNDPEIVDVATLEARGDSLLSTFGVQKKPSSLTTYHPGLKAGQNVQITHAGWSISAVTYRIAALDARLTTKDRIAYQVNFGNAPVSIGDLFGGQSTAIAAAIGAAATAIETAISTTDLSAGGGNLVPNSSFESGTSWGVGAQWVIGFAVADAFAGAKVARLTLAAANAGTLVTPFMNVAKSDFYWISFWHFLRSRSSGTLRAMVKEYNAASTLLATTTFDMTAVDTEWTRKAWRFGPAADPDTIAWQPTTAKIQISFDSAGAAATLTGDVDGVQLERGKILTAYAPTPFELLDGVITTTTIADDAVTTPKLIAGAVTTGKIAAFTITAANIAANAITADKVASQAIEVRSLAEPMSRLVSPNYGFEDRSGGAIGAYGNPVAGWPTTAHASAFGIFTTSPDTGSTVLLAKQTTTGTQRDITTASFRVQPGRKVAFKARVRGTAGNAAGCVATVLVTWQDQAGATISSNTLSYTVGSATAYATAEASITIPSSAVLAVLLVRIIAGNATNDVFAVDAIELYYTDDDLNHADGHVIINAAGITIYDTGGTAVLTAGGFGGSWDDFLASGGVYNNTFGSGTLGVLPAGSPNLPYWTISQTGASSAIEGTLEADSATGSGRRIKIVRTATGAAAGDKWGATARVPVVSQFPRVRSVPFTATIHFEVNAAGGGGLGGNARVTATARKSDGTALTAMADAYTFIDAETAKHDVSVTVMLDPTTAYVDVLVEFSGAAIDTYTIYWYGLDRTVADAAVPIETALASNYTLTTTLVASSLCLINLPPGRWLVLATVDFSVSATGIGQAVCELVMGSSVALVSAAKQIVMGDVGNGTRAAGSTSWTVDVANDSNPTNRVVELGFRKTINAGTAQANATHTSILAIPIVDGVR